MSEKLKKLKRAVIKEELVAITCDPIEAIILNQFIYWTERVEDYDKFIHEEKSRASLNAIEVNIEPTDGWIYKKAEELNEEIMLSLSIPTIRKYIKNLVEKGFLKERRNPIFKWDKTLQYRVDMLKLHSTLKYMGYPFENYYIVE